jgi:hypothetical protein
MGLLNGVSPLTHSRKNGMADSKLQDKHKFKTRAKTSWLTITILLF